MHHEPLATFKTDDPIDMELAKKSIGREALEKAFSDGGGGIKEIFENLKNATQIQALRKLGDEDKL